MSEITQHDIHRMSLEREAIHSLAQAIAINKLDAKELGEAMRTGIDALLGIKPEKTTQEAA